MALGRMLRIKKSVLAVVALGAMALPQLGCAPADLERKLAPEPLPTATPRDFLGMGRNKFMRITNLAQVQDLIDYYERRLTGRSLIGHTVPVVFVDNNDEWLRLFASPPSSPYDMDPKRQLSFLLGRGEKYSIYIRAGRPLWEVVAALCHESGGAYYIDDWLHKPGGKPDILIGEAAGLVFSGACLSVLREAGYDASVSKNPENEAIVRGNISSLSSEPNLFGPFRDVVLTAWAAADDLRFIDGLARSPGKRLGPTKQMELYRHLIAHDGQYFAPMIRSLAQDKAKMGAIEDIVTGRLVPGLPVRVNEDMLMEQTALYMVPMLYSP